MPAQTVQSTMAARLADRMIRAYSATKDKPVELGRQQLPAGIRNGVAKLTNAYTKVWGNDEKEQWKHGQEFFRASAVCVEPKTFGDVTTEGTPTSFYIELCDVPASGNKKARSYEENYDTFQNWFKMFGVQPPALQVDPNAPMAQKVAVANQILAYYNAAMKMLTDKTAPGYKPVYVSFSTRGWTPPKTALKPNPTEMVFEEWLAKADYHPAHDPSTNGVVDHNNHTTAPAPTQTGMEPGEPFTEPPQHSAADGAVEDPADILTALAEIADSWKQGTTPTDDQAAAIAQLEEAAKEAGATQEQVNAATNYAAVAMMAMGVMPEAAPAPTATAPAATAGPAIGSKWNYLRRRQSGDVVNNPGKKPPAPFPPITVEVTAVDAASKTCSAKGADGATVVWMGTKLPATIKWEWLEPVQ